MELDNLEFIFDFFEVSSYISEGLDRDFKVWIYFCIWLDFVFQKYLEEQNKIVLVELYFKLG